MENVVQGNLIIDRAYFKNWFARNLKHLRLQKNWSQEGLGKQLKVPRTKISGWEVGYFEPNLNSLVVISELFNVSIDDIISKDLSINPVSPN